MDETIAKIKDRWSDMSTKPYCQQCVYYAVRHWDRNVGTCDNPYDPHLERSDGVELSYASHDIHILLEIIEKLKVKT